jgi:hypothetical protein
MARLSVHVSPLVAPAGVPREERPHVCGKCRNPFTTGNPFCPNNVQEES